MFLKSLEIRGFKSFADKTELEFKKGVTAVVGPNGSGKSNISDAVRWVLGEQSIKSLRGGKMQDVIFAGTQFRKPLGLAQVSLVLDNSDSNLGLDYSQVKISRRIYRSGESEYFINNTKCRLKDVHELFMDTGIGKEGYSLIGQGKIDAILSGQSDDRRMLLEEAAGIVKFKTRKNEAEKRLDSTEQNLIRINDILGTYEERIEPLRIEKEKAEKFLEYSRELKTKEVNIVIDSIEKVESKTNEVKIKIEEYSNKLKEKEKEKENIKVELERSNKELDEFELKYSKERQEYYNNKSEKEREEANIKLLEERYKILEEQCNKYRAQLEELEGKLGALNKDKNLIITQKKEVVKESTEIKVQIDNLQLKIAQLDESLSGEDKKLSDIKLEHVKVLEKINESKNESIILSKEQEELNNRFEDMEFEINSIVNSIKINNNTSLALHNENEKVNNNILGIKGDIEGKTKSIQGKRSELSRREKDFNKLSSDLKEIEANHRVLVNLNEQYEGYTKAVKTLMQNINDGKFKGAKDKAFVLGEILTVDKELETAVEIALGGAISNIITEDENLAKKLIEHLKNNKLGRATFLPLNIVKGKLANDYNIKNSTGYIGIASKLVKYNDRFRNAIEHILGRTLIVDNIDSAFKIAKDISYSFKIVTLEGEVINPGGALTGGSIYHKSTNLISRKREIKELLDKKEIISNELKKKSDEIKFIISGIESLDEEILNLRDLLHSENIERTKIETKMMSMKNEKHELEKRQKEKERQGQLEREKLKKISERVEILHKQLEGSLSKKEIIENEIEIKSEMLKKDSVLVNDIKEQLTDSKIKKAQIDEVLANKDRELERVISDIEEQVCRKESIKAEISKGVSDGENALNKSKGSKDKVRDLDVHIKAHEEAFKDSEVKRIELKDRIKSINNKAEDIRENNALLDKEVNKQQIILAKVESELETLNIKLNEDLKLTYAEALELKDEKLNVSELNKDISTLKNRISNLGVVNVGAVEEYKELVEKFNFMNNQRNDLTNSKEELEKVIEEMTEKMRGVFRENFVILRKNFNETFKELFKGGSADLILSDGDELTAKIDINVQPPGKKLQNISLMSGGEKVLSAIALLFAILKMKPTPFCILDEIEAALDEANVSRYAEFLNKFSEKIQFIVITHRKGTMGVSDILYGVTMEEKGVSKIISIDMKNNNSIGG